MLGPLTIEASTIIAHGGEFRWSSGWDGRAHEALRRDKPGRFMAKSRWDIGSKSVLRVDQVRQALGDVGSRKVVLCCGREVDLGLRAACAERISIILRLRLSSSSVDISWRECNSSTSTRKTFQRVVSSNNIPRNSMVATRN